MVFSDRDSKARAETVLRKTCKLQCTTLYPVKLRKVIKNTIEVYRTSFLTASSMSRQTQLKLSRRAKAEKAKWINDFEVIALSDEVMELGSVSYLLSDIDIQQDSASTL